MFMIIVSGELWGLYHCFQSLTPSTLAMSSVLWSKVPCPLTLNLGMWPGQWDVKGCDPSKGFKCANRVWPPLLSLYDVL